jgi:hypothetical protein
MKINIMRLLSIIRHIEATPSAAYVGASLGVGPNSLKRLRDQLGQKRELSETTLEPCMVETVLSLSRNATWCAVSFKHLS